MPRERRLVDVGPLERVGRDVVADQRLVEHLGLVTASFLSLPLATAPARELGLGDRGGTEVGALHLAVDDVGAEHGVGGVGDAAADDQDETERRDHVGVGQVAADQAHMAVLLREWVDGCP